MTIVEPRQGRRQETPSPVTTRRAPTRHRPVSARPQSGRPRSSRPGGRPVQYRGTGVLMSRASHRRRPITPLTTVGLALVAAAITIWLGVVAQLGGVVGTPAQVPAELAVVQVQTGETLQHVAQRVAPEAPVSAVVERIRELNQLDTAAVNAGQTLIAPMG